MINMFYISLMIKGGDFYICVRANNSREFKKFQDMNYSFFKRNVQIYEEKSLSNDYKPDTVYEFDDAKYMAMTFENKQKAWIKIHELQLLSEII